MGLFHVYNRFDSMDIVHVSTLTDKEAVEIAKKDGYLTRELGVQECDIVAVPFSNKDQTSGFIRRINATSVVCWGQQ